MAWLEAPPFELRGRLVPWSSRNALAGGGHEGPPRGADAVVWRLTSRRPRTPRLLAGDKPEASRPRPGRRAGLKPAAHTPGERSQGPACGAAARTGRAGLKPAAHIPGEWSQSPACGAAARTGRAGLKPAAHIPGERFPGCRRPHWPCSRGRLWPGRGAPHRDRAASPLRPCYPRPSSSRRAANAPPAARSAATGVRTPTVWTWRGISRPPSSLDR